MRERSETGHRRLPARLVVLFALLWAAGCGPAKGTVTGKISYKNETLGGGRVTFITPDGNWAEPSAIGEDGTYTITGAPLGPVKITVETKSVQALAGKATPGKGGMVPPKDTPRPAHLPQGGGKYVPIPDEYADLEKTPLTYEITKGSQTHDIELK